MYFLFQVTEILITFFYGGYMVSIYMVYCKSND